MCALRTGRDDVARHPEGGEDADHRPSARLRLELCEVGEHDGHAAPHTATHRPSACNTQAVSMQHTGRQHATHRPSACDTQAVSMHGGARIQLWVS